MPRACRYQYRTSPLNTLPSIDLTFALPHFYVRTSAHYANQLICTPVLLKPYLTAARYAHQCQLQVFACPYRFTKISISFCSLIYIEYKRLGTIIPSGSITLSASVSFHFYLHFAADSTALIIVKFSRICIRKLKNVLSVSLLCVNLSVKELCIHENILNGLFLHAISYFLPDHCQYMLYGVYLTTLHCRKYILK